MKVIGKCEKKRVGGNLRRDGWKIRKG